MAPQKGLSFDLTFLFLEKNTLDNGPIEVETCGLVKLIYLRVLEAVF
jgi:hypothetical protein